MLTLKYAVRQVLNFRDIILIHISQIHIYQSFAKNTENAKGCIPVDEEIKKIIAGHEAAFHLIHRSLKLEI